MNFDAHHDKYKANPKHAKRIVRKVCIDLINDPKCKHRIRLDAAKLLAELVGSYRAPASGKFDKRAKALKTRSEVKDSQKEAKASISEVLHRLEPSQNVCQESDNQQNAA